MSATKYFKLKLNSKEKYKVLLDIKSCGDIKTCGLYVILCEFHCLWFKNSYNFKYHNVLESFLFLWYFLLARLSKCNVCSHFKQSNITTDINCDAFNVWIYHYCMKHLVSGSLFKTESWYNWWCTLLDWNRIGVIMVNSVSSSEWHFKGIQYPILLE